jgi:hypothetical protein
MLRNYSPIYQIALDLESLRALAQVLKGPLSISPKVSPPDAQRFRVLLEMIQRKCADYNFTHTSELARCAIDRPSPETSAELFSELTHLNDSLIYELNKEVFRIPFERKNYFEQDELFGSKVTAAFPSCERDIRNAGSCYALEQEDACVHHLMLVLERGLKALAAKVGVCPYQQSSWHTVITNIDTKTKTLPRGPDLDFYREVNAQFGFLKVAYRNHSEHAHDDFYDMPKALHILNHVRDFMNELERGGLSE